MSGKYLFSLSVLLVVAGVSMLAGLAAGGTAKTSWVAKAPDLGYVAAQLRRYEAPPRFVAPGPPFNARAAAGKSVMVVPISSAIPFVQAIVNGEQAAERLAGVKATIYPNTGQPPEWVAGVNAGIAQHANLISLVSANPAVLQPQLAQAKAAHIPVVESTLYDVGVPPTRGVTAVSPLPFSAGGRLMADYAILHSRGHVNAIVFVSREVVNAKYLERALRSEFAKHCGASCKMTVVNVPVTAWASRLQSEVQSALLKNPGANYVIPIYDGMVQFAVAGIRAAGATSRVQVISFNGTPAVLKMIQQGGPVVMDVGQPATWFGWIEADQNLRVLTGQKPVMAKEVPLRVFDKTNVASAGNPPTLDGGYGTKYVARFKKLWGLTK